MRIIVVEDEKITRQWVKKQIEEIRPAYDLVETFANGREALDHMEAQEADVLFTDIRMPVMDGLELLEELQRRENGAYKVILSAYDEFHYAQQALRLGANEFTLKPEITKKELDRILREAESWLEKQRKAKEVPGDPQEAKEIWMRQFLGRTGWKPKQPGRTAAETGRTEQKAGEKGQKAAQIGEDPRACGIDLDGHNLRAACISFPAAVPREKVMELLRLFLAEEKTTYFCMQLGVQSFVIFFNQIKTGDQEAFGRRLWELLQTHIGTDVYIGFSDVKDGYEQLGELLRQAADAKENRQFFGLSGYLYYAKLRTAFWGENKNQREFSGTDKSGISAGDEREEPDRNVSGQRVNAEKDEADGLQYPGDTVREILDAAEAGDFEGAKARTASFFAAAGKAHDLRPACIIAAGREILTGYMRRLHAYSLNEDESARLRQYEMLLGKPVLRFRQFCRDMLEAVGFLSDTLEQKERCSRYSPAVQKILQYVEENYGERISLEQVAAAAFLSRSYASVLFKKETGEKFSDYLQRIRIEKSCGLLKNSSLSIQETADRTGFFDAAHFSRVFKEKMGMSPMEYRKKMILSRQKGQTGQNRENEKTK